MNAISLRVPQLALTNSYVVATIMYEKYKEHGFKSSTQYKSYLINY